MRLYVESNFICELAWLQADSVSCLRIVERAERGGVELAIPAYCLMEPFERLGRLRKERELAADTLRRISDEMGRSPSLIRGEAQVREAKERLIESADVQERALIVRCLRHSPHHR